MSMNRYSVSSSNGATRAIVPVNPVIVDVAPADARRFRAEAGAEMSGRASKRRRVYIPTDAERAKGQLVIEQIVTEKIEKMRAWLGGIKAAGAPIPTLC